MQAKAQPSVRSSTRTKFPSMRLIESKSVDGNEIKCRSNSKRKKLPTADKPDCNGLYKSCKLSSPAEMISSPPARPFSTPKKPPLKNPYINRTPQPQLASIKPHQLQSVSKPQPRSTSISFNQPPSASVSFNQFGSASHLKHRFYLEWWRCTAYR